MKRSKYNSFNELPLMLTVQNGRKISLSFHSRNSVIIPDNLQHLFI